MLRDRQFSQKEKKDKKTTFWRWILVVGVIVLVLASAVTLALSRAEPILRKRVIETLSTRFEGKVTLDAFHVSLMKGLQVQGRGLKIFGPQDPNPQKVGVQPLIAIEEFQFQTGVLQLLRSPTHVNTVYLKGLQLNIPPKEQREQNSSKRKQEKIEVAVDEFICQDAQLVINTQKPDKLPLEFDITRLKMKNLGWHEPMRFEADLVNPKPVGDIVSYGSFGPWQADDPRSTPVKGEYSFSKADLGTINGIGGILSSTGKYDGTLEKIMVDGTTETPDFQIASAGNPVPLRTTFHAIVDGTSGDTYLQPVNATLGHSEIVAVGSVVRTDRVHGHHIQLDITVTNGRMEDLLKVGVKTVPPVMTGAVRLKTKFDLPPGEADVPGRIKLAGNFQVSGAHFTNPKVQAKVDNLSMRSQGKPRLAQDNIPDNVRSNLSGQFNLNKGLLSFSQLHFQAPGTQVNLTGIYSLDGQQFDFHGKARLDAKPSQLVTGIKSLLLKPVDPFFHKNGAGTEVGIKITGTKSEPHFGLDWHGGKDKEKSN